MADVPRKVVIIKKITQNDTVEDVFQKHPPSGHWLRLFERNIKEIRSISRILEEKEKSEGTFYPLKKDIFRAFYLTPFEKVKVVILGQDPYPQTRHDGLPRAQGLSFSVASNDCIPSSLQNIYKELRQEYPEYIIPNTGDLTPWAKQGVLLLNTCLTVRPGTPDSHKEIWKAITVAVLQELSGINKDIIYVLWGKKAQNYASYITGNPVILEATHPSGLSANRGFFGCGHFTQINEVLEKKGLSKIDWQI